jgi:hypothetical protein
VIAEGNETPGGDSGATPEGRGELRSASRNEGDLLAERRARRAAESGEHALTLRAEAAEATVRTLETHVASLQQRVREAEEERRRISEPAQGESGVRGSGGGWRSQEPAAEVLLERELQRASQREYAEQRLRIEAEDRSAEVERDTRSEVDQLSRRLADSESDARALSARVEALERELAEAEQAAEAGLAQLSSVTESAERTLKERLTELERRALEIHRGLDAERAARVRTERLLESMRSGLRGAVGLVGEVGDLVARLKQEAFQPPPVSPPLPAPLQPLQPAPPVARAPVPLASSGEGLLARGGQPLPSAVRPAEGQHLEMAEALAAAVERLRARVEEQPEHPRVAPPVRPSHKHSRSLIGRWRIARKQRRER